MGFVSLDTAKGYLRVDSSDEDSLIGLLLTSAERLCADIARLTPEEVEELSKVETDDDGNVTAIRTDAFSIAEVLQIREVMRIAVLYALGYLFEHREDADHHGLNLTLRSILFAVRERKMY